jgi:hypothetical protein
MEKVLVADASIYVKMVEVIKFLSQNNKTIWADQLGRSKLIHVKSRMSSKLNAMSSLATLSNNLAQRKISHSYPTILH